MKANSYLKFLVFSSAILVSACSSEEENKGGTEEAPQQEQVALTENELLEQIDQLKSDMEDDEVQDEKKLNKLIALCMDLVSNHPESDRAAEHLDLAAQLAYAKGNVKQSVNYYEMLIKDYPDFEGLEYAYFMYANHLDLDLRKIEEATEAYRTFIEKFPNSQFIPEAKMRMENIDMSMEDIIGKAQ